MKRLLKKTQQTLFDISDGDEHLHSNNLQASFIKIESMLPEEYKKGSLNLSINYSFSDSLFGKVLIASTLKGICYLAFVDEELKALTLLNKYLPNANFINRTDVFQQNALLFFSSNVQNLKHIQLHLKGTDFQIKVWKYLLKTPIGKLTTYGNIARQINKPNASRAIGTAIGRNPIAFIIPCHRVIQLSGKLGGYMWGISRKSEIIKWEDANFNSK